MARRIVVINAVVMALGVGSVLAGDAAPDSTGKIVLRRCELEYKRSSLIGVGHMGTTSTTILQDCLVRLGDRVTAGQVLGRVMDRDIRTELDLRTAEAANPIQVQLMETKAGLAANRLKRTQKLQDRNTQFVPAEEKVSQELEMSAANLQVEESRYELRLAEIKRHQAETLLRLREYISPHDGVVVEIHKEQGESVSSNEPVFRVVDVDWVRVTGYLNLGDYWRVRSGLEVRITPEIDGEDLPVEHEVFTGRIVFVDRRIDPSTRTCKVVAEVANRDLLLASGLEARMEISLGNTVEVTPAGERTGSSPPAIRPEKLSLTGAISPPPQEGTANP